MNNKTTLSFFRRLLVLDFSMLKRFAVSIAFSVLAFCIANWTAWYPGTVEATVLTRWTVLAAMGISVFLFPELGTTGQKHRLGAYGILAGIFALYFYASRDWSNVTFLYRTLQAYLLTHLLISLTPFTRSFLGGNESSDDKDLRFWSENWQLLMKFVMAQIQAVMLMVGAAIAILSVEKLFDLKISSTTYQVVNFFCIFPLSVMLFVSSVGTKLELTEPPEILKRIVRTVFTPLSIAYLIILHAYIIKIVVAQEWPRGGVGYLVSGLALIATLAYVIMRPLQNSDFFGPKLKSFWNISFRLLVLPLAILILGLARRVSEYGWTEPRVVLAILALWMVAMTFVYWRPLNRRLYVIPLSLMVVTLVTWFGPLSPASISLASQTSRLKELLSKPRGELSFEEKKSVNSSLKHICEAHGPDAMALAAGVKVEVRTSDADLRYTYGAVSHERICHDYQMTAPGSEGTPAPITQALTQLGIPKLDSWTSVDEPAADIEFHRGGHGTPVRFANYDYDSITFNGYTPPPPIGSTETEAVRFEEDGGGLVKFRFEVSSGRLEWRSNARPPTKWQNVDRKKVVAYIRRLDAETRRRLSTANSNDFAEDINGRIIAPDGESLRLLLFSPTTEVELLVYQVTFEGDKDGNVKNGEDGKIKSISFHALGRKKP